MLILSDKLSGTPVEPVATASGVFKTAMVPESVRVSNVPDGRALVVEHGGISILVTLTADEARVIAAALTDEVRA